MNIMDTYNGYKNKDTWEAMLYINNDEYMYYNIYEAIYNMIYNKSENNYKDYLYNQLKIYIKELNIPINIDNVDLNEIIEHINSDVNCCIGIK
jgi:hypothetical protein